MNDFNPRSARVMLARRARNNGGRDAGFTLLEILIAFTILAFMTLAVLPLFLNALKAVNIDSTTAASNSRITQELNEARTSPVTCTSLAADANAASYTDGRGNAFTITLSLPSGCTSSTTDQSVPVLLVAKRTADSRIMTSMVARVFVAGTAS